MSSNTVCNHTHDSTNRTTSTWLSDSVLITRMITDRIGLHSVLLPLYTQYLVVPTRKAIRYRKTPVQYVTLHRRRRALLRYRNYAKLPFLCKQKPLNHQVWLSCQRKSRRIQIALLLLSPNDFLFLFLYFDTVFKNSTPEKFANI